MNLKMYICVHEDVPDFMTPTLVGHSVLSHHLLRGDDERYKEWLATSYRKCTVKMSAKEFEKAKNLAATHGIIPVEGHENSTMDGKTSCLTIIVGGEGHEVPNVLKYAKLWKPTFTVLPVEE